GRLAELPGDQAGGSRGAPVLGRAPGDRLTVGGEDRGALRYPNAPIETLALGEAWKDEARAPVDPVRVGDLDRAGHVAERGGRDVHGQRDRAAALLVRIAGIDRSRRRELGRLLVGALQLRGVEIRSGGWGELGIHRRVVA